ncbi:MAG: CapA family protein [Candidatus Eisenbacteria bacterium]
MKTVGFSVAWIMAGCLALAVPAPARGEFSGEWRGGRQTLLCDFETGSASLQSYDGEDFDPSAWSIQSANTYGGSDYALRVWGNTWKQLAIDPYPLVAATVFQAALYSEERGEMQAIGFGDAGGNVLFYCVSGSQVSLTDRWNIVYQGAFPQDQWHAYRLPLGQDWLDTWGSLPEITFIAFVNDRDGTSDGITIFDEIYDVTDDLPVAPTVAIQSFPGLSRRVAETDLYRIEVQFQSLVSDPDGGSHDYHWDFGDGTTSAEPNPAHSFTAAADYTFTVALDVTDETGLFGRDTCQVAVEPSGLAGEISVNFTGDSFMGRGYEQSGGLIETYGVEYLWEPTLGMLGEAADLTMVNAECAFTDEGTPHPTKSVVFRTSPENVAGLVYAGVDVVSTGNNHIIDYGLDGLVETHAVFDGAGIVHGGSGVNAYFANQPCYVAKDGIRLGLINLCNRTGRQYGEQPFFDAGYDKFGLGYWLEPNIARAIAQADSLADIVIAIPHSGEEYVTIPPAALAARGDFVEAAVAASGREAGGPVIEAELCPPFVAPEDAPEFKFRIWPGASDRELRYRAIDLGAAAVLNSHPHVLQGFEVYEGALIAHSLGNFMFDLYYPETMPTIVLRARLSKAGILGWTFKPAFIDEWIPTPATGRLGREILDRMADYSRQLGTLVGVDADVHTGTIFLDPADAYPEVTQAEGTQPVGYDDGFYVSRPIGLAGEGSISRIVGLEGVGPGCEVRWGREVLWFGGFEQAEGYHMWDLNSGDEWLDDGVSHEGEHSLVLRRTGSGGNIVTMLEKHLPAADTLRYSLTGWMRTSAARGAKFSLRFYSQRYSWTQIGELDMGSAVDGTSDWTWYSRDIKAPDNSLYFNVRCNLDGTQGGEARAWFDDLRVVEWEPWQSLSLPMGVPSPNNFRFLQIRSVDPATSVTVTYEETRLTDAGASARESDPRHPVGVMMRPAAPNPFRGETALRFRLSAAAKVDLAILDVSGRIVEHLVRDEWMRPGWQRIAWPAGRHPTGVYFARLKVNNEEDRTQKLILFK